MKTTVGYYDFLRAFEDTRPNQFSRAALAALWDYFEQYEEDCGEEIELDVIAICCDFCEYENLEDFHRCYDKEEYPDFDTIEDYTTIIMIPDTERFIIQNF